MPPPPTLSSENDRARLTAHDAALRQRYRLASRDALIRQIRAHAIAAPRAAARRAEGETLRAADVPGRRFHLGQITRLAGDAVAGGQEHRVLVPRAYDHDAAAGAPLTARLLKITHSDRATGGCGLVPAPRGACEIVLRPGTIAEYLARLALTNALFGDDWRCEGALRYDTDGGCGVVTSQPAIGSPLGQRARPTAAEICRYFEARDFLPVAGSEAKTFYRVADNVAVFDAHEGNVVRTPEGLLPIDVIAVHPDDRLLAVLERGL